MAAADVHYRFRFGDNSVWECDVTSADGDQSARTDNLPDWTRLGFHRCSHCPLSTEEYEGDLDDSFREFLE
ncbi:hypothetical protein FDP08_13820 [Marinobacter panjinensis]|uniref:Uncharacterized protein n=1 Tax=Marinobacter panjinensis TaxID=2576384 RepID=A0A4U6R6B7_9GAMM|nr:hypothetical protein [Marinobacter panjinensis]TKV69091.1 hypothetical protein FDP08_13820 [Marinobacter panjinensis]